MALSGQTLVFGGMHTDTQTRPLQMLSWEFCNIYPLLIRLPCLRIDCGRRLRKKVNGNVGHKWPLNCSWRFFLLLAQTLRKLLSKCLFVMSTLCCCSPKRHASTWIDLLTFSFFLDIPLLQRLQLIEIMYTHYSYFQHLIKAKKGLS